jgi:hypothetical protein
LHRLPRSTIVNVLLFLSVIDVFTSSFGVINRTEPRFSLPEKQAFVQQAYYINEPWSENKNMRLFRETKANIGEIYGYEPILGFGGNHNETGYDPLIKVCGQNRGCNFVLTGNAELERWSPNEIVLKRTADGPIEVNMNPGNAWLINGKREFANMRVVELTTPFTITDSSDTLLLSLQPK